jgi:GGDEF domain-containing protein
MPGVQVAMRVAARIGRELERSFSLSCGAAQLRGSVGVACCNGAAVSAEELVRRADTAMYASKERGEGQPVLAAAA